MDLGGGKTHPIDTAEISETIESDRRFQRAGPRVGRVQHGALERLGDELGGNPCQRIARRLEPLTTGSTWCSLLDRPFLSRSRPSERG